MRNTSQIDKVGEYSDIVLHCARFVVDMFWLQWREGIEPGPNRDVAALEDWYVSYTDMPKAHFVVRVHRLFHWQDGAYSLNPGADKLISLDTSANMSLGEWHALLHGKVCGKVTIEAGNLKGVLGTDRYLPAAFMNRPRKPEFGWWDVEGDAAKQPVVLVNHVTNRCDCESWHSGMAEKPVPENVLRSFCQNVVVYTCDEKDASTGRGRTRIDLSTDWVRNNVDILQHLKSSRGDELWALRFREIADVCDNWFGHYDAQHWFSSSARSANVKYLGSEIALVDYGDFNCDGRTEFLFRVKKYNEDGYRIFWDRFEKTLDYTWNYH